MTDSAGFLGRMTPRVARLFPFRGTEPRPAEGRAATSRRPGISRKSVRLAAALVGVFGLTVTCVLASGVVRVRYHVARAEAALARRDARDALRHLTIAESLDAERGEVQFLLARAYRRAGDSAAVFRHLDRAKRSGHPAEALRREWVLARAQSGMLKEAAPHLAGLLVEPGDDGAEICEAFVNGYLQNYRYADAFRLLDAWVADFPEDPLPRLARGRLYLRWERTASAEKEFRSALSAAPDSVEARFALALSLSAQHRHEEAAAEFARVLEAEPDRPEHRIAWADCLMNMGRPDEALAIFREAVETDPENTSALAGLGRACLSAGRPEEAAEWLDAAVRRSPRDPEVRYSLAQALQASGRPDAARPHRDYFVAARPALSEAGRLSEDLVREPADAEKRYRIGKILLEYGSSEEGATWLRTVLEVAPDHLGAHRALFEYYSGLGRHAEAERHERFLARQDAGSDG